MAVALSTIIATTLLVKTTDDRPADDGVAAAAASAALAAPTPEDLPALPATPARPSSPMLVDYSLILRAARQGGEETALRAAAASRAVTPAFDFVGLGPVSSQPQPVAQEVSAVLAALAPPDATATPAAPPAPRAVAPAFDFVGFGPVSSQPQPSAQQTSATLAAVVASGRSLSQGARELLSSVNPTTIRLDGNTSWTDLPPAPVGDVGAMWVGLQAVAEAQQRVVVEWLATLRGWPAVVPWTVGPRHTLAAIAREARTTVAAIIALNGLADPNHIYVGQRLTIPLDFALPAPAPANPGAPFFGEPR